MNRLTKRINGRLTLTKEFPTLADTLDCVAERLELMEEENASLREEFERVKQERDEDDAIMGGLQLQARNAADRLDRDDSKLRSMLENVSGCGQILKDALHPEAISLLRMIEQGELVPAAAGGTADGAS